MFDDENRGGRRTHAEGAEHDCAALPRREQLRARLSRPGASCSTRSTRGCGRRGRWASLPSDFTRATAIFFGHGHWDHIADAPEVAKQTNAKMYGGAADDRVAEDERRPGRAARDVEGRRERKGSMGSPFRRFTRAMPVAAPSR